jgi:hypothetical protein
VFNVVYTVVQEIQCDKGSILNLERDEIVQRFDRARPARRTAEQCVSFFNADTLEISRFPLRDWLKQIQTFYLLSSPKKPSLMAVNDD